jgi:DNA-binding transcriptional MerR regulator/quercetin dioxygenase-like cupin family protein
MAYTVKHVAEMSGVSARTLRFYDETGLLKPARTGANGYRYYEEPQLLTLQQILFYRELGFGLQQIRQIVGRADFQQTAALESHRRVLYDTLARTRRLIETIDRTLDHLEGKAEMASEELFAGFRVAAGSARFGEHNLLDGDPMDCKVSGRDTGGAMCIFEFRGNHGRPRHLHHDQDEWIYVIDGEVECHVGDDRLRLRPGESVFMPRGVAHVWGCVGATPGRILNVYQPAGTMEAFYHGVGEMYATRDTLTFDAVVRWFRAHGMELLGPPLDWDERATNA